MSDLKDIKTKTNYYTDHPISFVLVVVILLACSGVFLSAAVTGTADATITNSAHTETSLPTTELSTELNGNTNNHIGENKSDEELAQRSSVAVHTL